jgi:tetratricopeptide (TPR) repeat protein
VIAQRDLARLLWEGGQYDLALNHFERAVQINPNLPGALSDLGRAYELLGRPTDAEGAFRRMATIPSAHHIALYELGNLAKRRGDAQTAMQYYAQSVESKSDYVPALYSLGVAFEDLERSRDAYEAYTRVLQLEPPEDSAGALDYVDALFRMGRLDLKMGAVERAAEILAEVVEAYPAHPEAHYEFGRALQLLEREEEAQREFAAHEQLMGEQVSP